MKCTQYAISCIVIEVVVLGLLGFAAASPLKESSKGMNDFHRDIAMATTKAEVWAAITKEVMPEPDRAGRGIQCCYRDPRCCDGDDTYYAVSKFFGIDENKS